MEQPLRYSVTIQTMQCRNTEGHPTGKLRDNRYILDEQPGYLLRLAVQYHTAIFNRLMEEELTQTQFAALSKILEQGRCSQSDLARLIELDTATVHGVVERTRARGLVVVSKDPKDRRRRILSLSVQGEDVVRRAHVIARRISRETLVKLSGKERERLLFLLRKMAAGRAIEATPWRTAPVALPTENLPAARGGRRGIMKSTEV